MMKRRRIRDPHKDCKGHLTICLKAEIGEIYDSK